MSSSSAKLKYLTQNNIPHNFQIKEDKKSIKINCGTVNGDLQSCEIIIKVETELSVKISAEVKWLHYKLSRGIFNLIRH